MARPADYTEDLVPILLQAALTAVDFPRFRYRILPISRHEERHQGYDAHVTLQMYTFYMQFKKPWSPTEAKMKADRTALKLNNHESDLFFKLHQAAKTRQHEQHNALHALKKKAKAAYVCPLYTDPTEYQAAIHQSMWEATMPWLQPIHLFFDEFHLNELHLTRTKSVLEEAPAFRNHISIPPHGQIKDVSVHKYSFDKFGTEVAFHSPKTIEDALPFGSWLQEVYKEYGERKFRATDRERFVDIVNTLPDVDTSFEIPNEVSLTTWQNFGDYLERQYGIRQYGFVQRPE